VIPTGATVGADAGNGTDSADVELPPGAPCEPSGASEAVPPGVAVVETTSSPVATTPAALRTTARQW
jgi:hypothetical protein